jgi:hypothetical protein
MRNDRGDLVTQRFAGAGGQEHDRVLAVDERLDRGFLSAAKRGVAEDVAKDRRGRDGVGRRSLWSCHLEHPRVVSRGADATACATLSA